MMSGCEGSESKKKRGHGFLIWALCFCIMLAGYSELSGAWFVLAKEEESLSGNDISDISEETLVLPKEEESLSDNDISTEVYAEVYAEEAEAPETDRRSQTEAMWQTNEGWVKGSLSEAVEKVVPGGTVVLLSDVSLTNGLTISKSMWITSYDAGKPFTIKNTTQDTVEPPDSGRIFTVTRARYSYRILFWTAEGTRESGLFIL